MFKCRYFLLNGKVVYQNKSKVCQYFKNIADKGDIDCMHTYAVIFDDGEGIFVNKYAPLLLYLDPANQPKTKTKLSF